MGCMGLIPNPHHLVAVLIAALQKAMAKGILMTGIGLLVLPLHSAESRKKTKLAWLCAAWFAHAAQQGYKLPKKTE